MDDLQEIKDTVDKKKAKLNRLEGILEEKLDAVKKEFKVKTLDDLRKLRDDIVEKRKKTEEQLAKLMDRITGMLPE